MVSETLKRRVAALEAGRPSNLADVPIDYLGIWEGNDPLWEDVRTGPDGITLQRNSAGELRGIFREPPDGYPEGADLRWL